jgi:hypothetical protein
MDDTARMTHRPPAARTAASLLVLLVLLAGCRVAGEPTDSASPSPLPSASASAQPTDGGSPSPSSVPSATATATPPDSHDPSPTSSAPADSTFAIAPHPEADTLFLDRDDCANRVDGYRLQFPDAWWTNTLFGDVQPCRWFSPTFYEVTTPDQVPDEIAIIVELVDGDVGWADEIVSREEGMVGVTQPAVRVDVRGSAGDGGTMPADWREYAYVVQLGPSPEEGPNLVLRTNTDMGGDHDTNRAVLDRIVATIEFIGTVQ